MKTLNRTIKMAGLAAVAILPMAVSASTLEFWSLGAGTTPETLDLSPTIDSSHVLSTWSSDSGTFSTCLPAFKGVPQNQDFTTGRNSSALTTLDAPRALICDSDDLRTAATLGNDFTFEGWFKLSSANNLWLFGTRKAKGWYLQFTNSGGFKFYCGAEYTLPFTDYKTKLRNKWSHVAFVWHHTGGDNGYGYCELFLDYELVATTSMTAAPTTTEKDGFYIGGRGTGGSTYQGGKFAVDCVRFSDSALSSGDFLRAADMAADTYVAPSGPDVVGFWRMDEDSPWTNSVSGGVGMRVNSTNPATVWTNDSAVTRIQNMEWSTWTADGDNYDHGSVRLSASYSPRLYADAANGVSKYLSLTNDFTVEMWLKIPRTLPSSWAILTGVHTIQTPRWWVIIRNNQYMPMVQGANSPIADNLPFTNGTEKCMLTTDDIGKWRHHAIVFEKNKGAHGTLSIYIDGIYRGSREFTTDYAAASSEALAGYTFDIGGREGGYNSFNDLGVDLVRVTKRALGTNEFLNAASAYHPPAAATVTNRVVETRTAALVTNDFETASYVTFNRPFTIEGLVRIDEGATYPQKLAECKVSNGGWILTATNSCEMLLKVMDSAGVTIAEKSFSLPKDDFTWWRHLEVAYNFGLWNIYVDKDFAGSVTNDSFAGTDALPMMMLGSESGKVQHQKWRIVNNALLPEDFDEVTAPGRGMIIIFR